MSKNTKPILDVLQRKSCAKVPFWLMRQAGRYLPEYRELRAQAGSFLNLAYNPSMAAEVTIQPLRRFGMDGAILFSDILIVPHALGQDLAFETGEGPKLPPLREAADLAKLDIAKINSHCAPIYETVERVRGLLQAEWFDDVTLIGFCGSPWTVACYMVEGGSSPDFSHTRSLAKTDPDFFAALIDLVTEASCLYLEGQIKAGAETLQLFDSWAGLVDADDFTRWVIDPAKKIRAFIKQNYPHIPVIGFPRGCAKPLLERYAQETGVDCIGLGQEADRGWAAQTLQPLMPVQGNLDPVLLRGGGAALEGEIERICADFGNTPFIFNLGHGIHKETPIENVTRLSSKIREWKR
ncbi:MAG: uroporphyrinogen decarboxylase [Micavibrio sp.]